VHFLLGDSNSPDFEVVQKGGAGPRGPVSPRFRESHGRANHTKIGAGSAKNPGPPHPGAVAAGANAQKRGRGHLVVILAFGGC